MNTDSREPNQTLTETFRARLREALHTAFRTRTNTLIVAPTSLGKTHEVATTQWTALSEIVGTPFDLGTPVIHVSQSKEARDQAYKMSRETPGVNPHILRGREEACPVAKGEYDDDLRVPPTAKRPSEWLNLKCDVQGVLFSDAHSQLEQLCGGLPCSGKGPCGGVNQWTPVLDGSANEYDTIHVTETFVYNSELIRDRHVVFDERPNYTENIQERVLHEGQIGRTLTHGDIRNGITEFLQAHPSKHRVVNWEGLITAVNSQNESVLRTFQTILDETEFGENWYVNIPYVSIGTPTLIQAILNAKPVANGYLRGEATFSHSDDSVTREITVVIDDKSNIKLLHEPPNLEPARSVVGFDAHPTERLWRANTVFDLKIDDLGLTTAEHREWRQKERGLTVYQVSDATRSYTGGWAGDTAEERKRTSRRAKALINHLHELHSEQFRTAITAKAIKQNVEGMLGAVGVPDPSVLHYGNLRSRGDFEGETVGLLIGCIDPGDENILTKLALLNLEAQPVEVVNEAGEKVREVGRTFTGPDADAATEILESVREMEIAQAIGRYARRNEDLDSKAIVYVWTDAIPPELFDQAVPGVVDILYGKQEAIATYVSSSPEWVTLSEVVDGIESEGIYDSISKEHIRMTLNRLVSRDQAEVQKGTGYYGADEYWMEPGKNTDRVDLVPG